MQQDLLRLSNAQDESLSLKVKRLDERSVFERHSKVAFVSALKVASGYVLQVLQLCCEFNVFDIFHKE